MNDTSQVNTEEENKTESPVMTAARQYFMELARKSDSLRGQIIEAKTRTKKQYLQKKLNANNKVAIELLQGINDLAETKNE